MMKNLKKLLTVSTFAMGAATAFAAPKESAKFDRAPASSGEQLEALTDDESRFHLAQVVAHEDIAVKKMDSVVSLVTVWDGGIQMPFRGVLNIFDPNPTEGGDFGSFQSFSLGNYGSHLKLIDSKLYQVKVNEQVLSLAFTTSIWDPNTDKTSIKVVRFRVNISNGVVAKKAILSIKDR